MVTLLAFNVKIEKSIQKYFIAEESSNVTILDGNISWCRYLFGHRRKMGIFALREAFYSLQNGHNVVTRYLSRGKTEPTHNSITVNSSQHLLFYRV